MQYLLGTYFSPVWLLRKILSKGFFGIFLKQGVGRNENYHKALTGVILGNFLGLFPGNINFFIFSFSLRTLQKNSFFFNFF